MANREFTQEFIPNPTQHQFITSRAEADVFACRIGEGKSAGLVWALRYHVAHNPGARHALIRDTTVNLERTTMKEFFKWFPPGIMGSYKADTKTFTWASGIAQGEVIFLGLDDAGDASKLQSLELAGFAIDEPAPAVGSAGVDELIFDVGMGRLRQPDMNWYIAKLAENNPDESHWTYQKFVDPGTDGFKMWQTSAPENEKHLPPDYYAKQRYFLRNRPDLVRRFVEGKFGFQQEGKAVTPEWNDLIHLDVGLNPIRGQELVLLWDFGLNPTCIVTQITPMRLWFVLDALVGDGIGVDQLIKNEVKPLLADKYRGFSWRHIGDPQGSMREQSNSEESAVRVIRRQLGGVWRPGPRSIQERVQPLRAVWHSLRGGWHHHVTRTGLTSGDPVKDIHSHPGDAMGYGAAILFPLGKLLRSPRGAIAPASAPGYFGSSSHVTSGLGFEKPGAKIPPGAKSIGGA